MKKFLLMMLLIVSSLSVWGQPFYKFTATADGKLYTDADDASIATTPKGAVCNSSYYVKSDYVNTTAPSTTTSSAFSTKAYYVKDGDNYTCAFGQSYNSGKTYANVALATQITGANESTYVNAIYVFTENATDSYFTKDSEENYTNVSVGQICDPSVTYYASNGSGYYSPGNGATIIGWHDANTTSSKAFSSTSGIYTCEGEGENVVYTQISSLDYDEYETYYAVTFSDLSDEQETTMATNASNFSSATIVTGLSEPSGIYYYDGLTASYKLVHNGDGFLGDDKYYIPGSSFALMTPAELLVLGYVDDVYGLVSLEPSTDGQTLSVICAGDVCDPEEDYESTGYKFQDLAPDWLFSDELGTVVANNDMYVNKPYYTRVPIYQSTTIPTTLEDVYTFKIGVELYKENNSNYVLSTDLVWDKQEDAETNTNYFTRAEAGTYSEITDFSQYTNSEPIFDSRVNSIFLIRQNMDGTVERMLENERAIEGNYYNLQDSKKVTYWGDLLNSETNQFQGTLYHVKVKGEEITKVNIGDTYDSEASYYPLDYNTAEYNKGNYCTNKLVFIKVVYRDADGTDQVEPGALKNEETYYQKDYTYTRLTAETVKSDTYTTFQTVTRVQTGGTTYYKGDGKTIVTNNEEYEPLTAYFIGNGYDYTEKTKEALISEDKLTNVTIANNYWEALVNDINTVGYKTVKFVSQDSSHPAQICNNVTQAMMKLTSTRVLDMADVAISSIDSPFKELAMTNINQDASGNNLGTFMTGDNGREENNSIETLYTPQVTSEHFELGVASFIMLPKLRYLHLSEGIEVLGQSSIFARSFHLSQITFPNSLKKIKTDAVSGHYNASDHNSLKDLDGNTIPYIETLTFPSGLEEIETGAFGGTCPKDVYFLGVDAPKVAANAWGDDAYISNNALSPVAADLNGVNVDQSSGYSTRMNYIAQSGWITMLHFPAACTKAQAAKYTDVTRSYLRIENYLYTNDGHIAEPEKVGGEEGDKYNIENPKIKYDGMGAYYTPGQESSSMTGHTGKTVTAVEKTFYNTYDNFDTNGAGAYTGGFFDYTVGSQILWPSMVMAYRATVAAQNNVLWDGVTTIGQGIVNAGGSYSEDGTEYIGLHQFVLAAADVTNDDTKEYPLDKYADGKWHTICVPFNMTKKQMKETFGASGKHKSTSDEIAGGNYVEQSGIKYTYEFNHLRVCKFNEVIRGNETITLKFNNEQFINAADDAIVIEAHTPYMIHAEKGELVDGSGTATAKFNGYVHVPGVASITEIASTGDSSNGIYTFAGNYNAFTTDGSDHEVYMPQYCYFFNFSAQALKFQIGTNGKWTPHAAIVRAADGTADNTKYFTTPSVSSRVRTMFFGDIDDEETAIEKIAIEADGELIYTNAPVYNLSGQVVGNSLDNLVPGIYIVNGKKSLVSTKNH